MGRLNSRISLSADAVNARHKSGCPCWGLLHLRTFNPAGAEGHVLETLAR